MSSNQSVKDIANVKIKVSHSESNAHRINSKFSFDFCVDQDNVQRLASEVCEAVRREYGAPVQIFSYTSLRSMATSAEIQNSKIDKINLYFEIRTQTIKAQEVVDVITRTAKSILNEQKAVPEPCERAIDKEKQSETPVVIKNRFHVIKLEVERDRFLTIKDQFYVPSNLAQKTVDRFLASVKMIEGTTYWNNREENQTTIRLFFDSSFKELMTFSRRYETLMRDCYVSAICSTPRSIAGSLYGISVDEYELEYIRLQHTCNVDLLEKKISEKKHTDAISESQTPLEEKPASKARRYRSTSSEKQNKEPVQNKATEEEEELKIKEQTRIAKKQRRKASALRKRERKYYENYMRDVYREMYGRDVSDQLLKSTAKYSNLFRNQKWWGE